VWLEIAEPADGETQAGPVGWREVRGFAGERGTLLHDVMVVVDVSGSTLFASGADVDADGHTGRARRRIDTWRTFNPSHYSSDPDDTVLAAELLSTRRLVERLDPVQTRVGLVAFADGVQLAAPLGSDADALAAGLAVLADHQGSGATNLAAAIDLATRALLAAGGKWRQKSIVILSDGYPTAPGSPRRAAADALERARAAGEAGLRIHSYALGSEPPGGEDVYARIAAETGGRYQRLASPGEILNELPRIDLSRVAEVAIANATSGEDGRSVRVFPDGSFDGFVRLVPGENLLRVRARGESGGEHRAERRVVFERRAPRDAEEERRFALELEALKRRLEHRALEAELSLEMQQERGADPQRRELEVAPENAAP
jgi:hypothetical protein